MKTQPWKFGTLIKYDRGKRLNRPRIKFQYLSSKNGCNEMQGWKANLIEGTIFLVVGLIIIAINFLTIEAIDFLNNGNQITASLNPTFFVLLIAGFFLLGVGTAQSAVTITIRKLESYQSSGGGETTTVTRNPL
jgi:hypothetical protein